MRETHREKRVDAKGKQKEVKRTEHGESAPNFTDMEREMLTKER